MNKLMKFISSSGKMIGKCFELARVADRTFGSLAKIVDNPGERLNGIDKQLKVKKILIGDGFTVYYIDQMFYPYALSLSLDLSLGVMSLHTNLLSVARTLSFKGLNILSVEKVKQNATPKP